MRVGSYKRYLFEGGLQFDTKFSLPLNAQKTIMNLIIKARQSNLLLASIICQNRWLSIAILTCLLILSWPAGSYAQEPFIHFERISLEQGLSHGTVFSIVQDQTGFLWFGSQSGLNKYDGYNITVFRHDPNNPNSVSNDNAGNLYIDRSGVIWIGTWGGGLSKFVPHTEQFTAYLNDPDDPTSLSNDRVQTIYEDRSGILWVGTAGGGLNKFDRQTETFTHYQHDPDNPHSLSHDRIWGITEDEAGMLWLATSDGLNKFDPQTETFTRYFHDPADPNSLSHSLIRTLYVDRAGVLWVGAEVGLNKFNPETGTFTRYLHDPTNPHSLGDDIINAIFEDSTGNFWIGTSRGGLNKFDREGETFIRYVNNPQNPNSLSHNDVRWILEDRSGVLWIATRGGGVNKLVLMAGQFTYLTADPDNANSLNNNDVRAIYVDRAKNLWIGTRGGGLNKFDPQTGIFTHYQHDPDDPNSLSSDDVYAIHEDRSGILWLGLSGGGLVKFDPHTETFTRYQHNPDDPVSLSSEDVNSIYEDRLGMLWIGTKGGGLNKFNPETGQFTPYQHDPDEPSSLGNDDVYAVYEDESGALWVSTYGGGLNKFDRETERFIRYQYNPDDPTSLSNNDVYALYEDPSGLLWIGTANGGLNKFDRETGQFVRFTAADGLSSDVIYGILPDEQGNLWLSTSLGLSKFEPRINNFVNYDVSDGLKSVGYHEGAYYKSSSGEMFFGGINGLVRFDPEAIQDNAHIPPVVLTGFELPHKEITLNQPLAQVTEIELSHEDDVFSFEFVVLDYANPAKNQYAYKLEGFDQDWIAAGNRRFATYTNLDPGTYTFRVKGSNNAGVWNEAGLSIKITVTPPFWETVWFRIVIVASVLGLVFTGYHLRVHSIEAQRRKLQTLVTERTAELSEANQHLRTLTDRLQHELTMARVVQQNLLPPPRPNWSSLDVLCYSIPAREVGGDFYAYYAFGNPSKDHFAVAVGDVSGKGMPAALLMAVSLTSLQSSIAEALAPAELLAQLDAAIIPYTRTGLENCALCYAEIKDRTLRVANAGCVPPLIRRTNGLVEWVDIGGTPLGVGLGAQDGYVQATLPLAPGDLVILTSDGIVEAMTAAREMFGFERLEQAVATGPSRAEDMLAYVRAEVLAFVGESELYDDLTIVVLQA